MKALSIRQPWAHAILFLGKDIENRTWNTNYRGRFYIHAGLREDPKWRRAKNHKGGILITHDMQQILTHRGAWSDKGGILGSVELFSVTEWSRRSRWFAGKYGFILRKPKAYDHVIECKGNLGFFDPPKSLAKELMRAEQA